MKNRGATFRFIFIRVIIVFVAVRILAYLGHSFLPDTFGAAMTPIAIAIVAVLALLGFVISPIFPRFYLKKKQENVARTQSELRARSEHVRENYELAAKRLDRIHVILILYAIVQVLLLAFVCVLPLTTLGAVIVYPIAFLLLLSLLSSFRFREETYDFSEYTNPEDYPKLHAIAKSVADELGVSGNIRIFLESSDDVAILKTKNGISLCLGVLFLSCAREEEFRAVLLHEFAHIKTQTKPIARHRKFNETISSVFKIPVLPVAMQMLVTVYTFEYVVFTMFSSILVEKEADRMMAERGDEQVVANTFFKLFSFGLFSENIDINMGEPLYASEVCPTDYYRRISQKFLEKMQDEAFFRHMLAIEIEARSATHPIMRSRIEPLGVDEVYLTLPETDGDYRAEADKAIKELDSSWYQRASAKYQEARMAYYLDPLKTVAEWEAEGRGYTAENARSVIDALDSLLRYDDILTLCDAIIENEEGGFAAFAFFTRGKILLSRYEESGIEDLYRAAESNSNYIESAMQLIGSYCCRAGLQEALEEYRERSVAILQRGVDVSDSNMLTASDKLRNISDEVLPRVFFERNLTYILSVGETILNRVFLVNKQLKNEHNCNAYVFEFVVGTTEDEVDAFMQRMFEFLDNAPEDLNYAIFVYDPITAAAVRKVSKACIYQKANN